MSIHLSKEACLVVIEKVLSQSDVTEKHKEVCESIRSYINKKGRVSPGQANYIKSIGDCYSEEVRQEKAKWVSEYDDEKKERVKICTGYYEKTPYYSDIVKKVRENPDAILTHKQYKAYCENKYAKKVIATHENDFIFPVGKIVQVRATVNTNTLRSASGGRFVGLWAWKLKNEPVIIIGHKDTPHTHKIYHVMLLGKPDSQFLIEERFLKKNRIKV